MRLSIYLTPLIPLSFKGEGEIGYIREASPLFNSLHSRVVMEEFMMG